MVLHTLRIIILSHLLFSWAETDDPIPPGPNISKRERRSWYFGPQYSHNHYFSGNYGNHGYHQAYQHHISYRSQRACTYRRSCYDYMLVFSGDGYTNISSDAPRFESHYADGGYDKDAMITEGKCAAQYFLEQFGVNATGLHDKAYLAPQAKFPGDVIFRFRVTSPPRPLRLTMASKWDQTQFYNVPVRVAYWELKFRKPYNSTGWYKRRILRGGSAKYGSYLIDTCPKQHGQQSCNSILSKKQRGRVFIRFWSQRVSREKVEYQVQHEEWGMGEGKGLFNWERSNPKMIHARLALTFPESCDIKAGCHPKRKRQKIRARKGVIEQT